LVKRKKEFNYPNSEHHRGGGFKVKRSDEGGIVGNDLGKNKKFAGKSTFSITAQNGGWAPQKLSAEKNQRKGHAGMPEVPGITHPLRTSQSPSPTRETSEDHHCMAGGES